MADAARTDIAGGVLVLDPFQHAQLRHGEEHGTQTGPYLELQRRLRAGEVEQHLTALSTSNSSLVDFLKRFGNSLFYNRNPEGSAARARHDKKRSFIYELIVSLLVRILNVQVWCHLLVCLSLASLQKRLPLVLWNVLSTLRILYSSNTTRQIARDLGVWSMSKVGFFYGGTVSPVVCAGAYDNCEHRLRTKHEHVDVRSDFYKTINWFLVPLPLTHDEDIKKALADNNGRWHNGAADLSVVAALTNIARHTDFNLRCWGTFLGLVVAGPRTVHSWSVLDHPSNARDGPTRRIFQKHVPTEHGTASLNREVKTGLYAGGKRCDIDSLIVQLNGTRGATEKLFAALGLESRVREDSRATSKRDVDALLAALREAHPPDQFFATSDATPLWTAPQAPATDLRSGHRPAGPRRTPSERVHAERADLRSYIERRLDNPLLDE